MGLKFEQLKVWQKSLDLSAQVNELAKKCPKEELYILTSQMKRAADSVSLSIVEWCPRGTFNTSMTMRWKSSG